MYLCYGMAGMGLIYLLVIIKLFNKINLSIGFVRASA